jgi:hypothetical protein
VFSLLKTVDGRSRTPAFSITSRQNFSASSPVFILTKPGEAEPGLTHSKRTAYFKKNESSIFKFSDIIFRFLFRSFSQFKSAISDRYPDGALLHIDV